MQTLGSAQRASESLVQSAIPVINAVCEQEVAKCEAAQDRDCPGYYECAEVRQAVVKYFILIQRGIAIAEAAIAIGEEDIAFDAVQDVTRLLFELRSFLKDLGLL